MKVSIRDEKEEYGYIFRVNNYMLSGISEKRSVSQNPIMASSYKEIVGTYRLLNRKP